MDANTGQICAALMTQQDEGDGEVLPDLLDQIPNDVPIDTIGGDGAYDTRPCHEQIASRAAIPAIPPREGAIPWPDASPSAAWRNAAIDAIAKSSRREWKQESGYHRRSLAEALMYRLKILTGPCLWAREIGSQATEVSIRAGVQPHGGACPPAVCPYRLRSKTWRSLRPDARFTQQRPQKA
ncbi:hypothetical protein FHX59_002318 [Paraburkholderia silvatlantica]|uniref:Transposase IS4-like domain-containing protein n=1 Tax=Paraburkholderia silvatlantica TaxID=321895 RepID=A0ABR6FKE2_9BURK|nr:hypothetical protein [Paraburkholderia silvatlantica]